MVIFARERICEKNFKINTLQQVEQETNFINAALWAGVAHIVKYSARGAALDMAANLTRWYGQTEKLLEESGIAYTHIQTISFMQNFFGFLSDDATCSHDRTVIG